MNKKIKLSQDMVGKKVRCVNKINVYNPKPGTIGTIVIYDEFDAICSYKVQWPKGSTVGYDRWWVNNRCIELVEDDVTNEQKNFDMTNEEIWKMLWPKMEKNNILVEPGVLYQGEDKLNKLLNPNILEGKYVTDVYDATVARYAIVLAYRSGYERAIKGRPFKISEKKKQGGHWEPIDPENLPKEGTKVRYKGGIRKCNWEKNKKGIWVINETDRFAIRFNDMDWSLWCMNELLEHFDMWVEDDE